MLYIRIICVLDVCVRDMSIKSAEHDISVEYVANAIQHVCMKKERKGLGRQRIELRLTQKGKQGKKPIKLCLMH